MKRHLLALVVMMPTIAVVAAEVDQAWIMDANGCKLLLPPDVKLPAPLQWNGSCVDGYVSGFGAAETDEMGWRGEFVRGVLVSGEWGTKSGMYTGSFKNNLPDGNGEMRLDDGVVVRGAFKQIKPIGIMDITWPNGSSYRGEVLGLDTMHGQGKLTFLDGTTYEGDFVRGQYEGKGKTMWADGSSYTGDFVGGNYQGHGVLITGTGSSYDGDFVAGKRHGTGTAIYPDGSRFVGEFFHEQLQGQGRYEHVSGLIQEGEWKADTLHGKCSIIFPDRSSYSGQCIASQPSGQGHYENPASGIVYDGAMLAGKYHGRGRLTEPGMAYEGEFVGGILNGRGKQVFQNGERYEGEFLHGMRDGKGVLRATVVNGSEAVYDGTFKQGLMDGPGKLTFGKATSEGEFKRGMLVRGRVHTADDRTIEVDAEAGTSFEIKKDGTKVPFEPEPALNPSA